MLIVMFLKERCVYCGKTPCDRVLFEEEIVEECEVLEELKRSNKEIRHHAYCLYTWLKHGVLRKYDHRPLPNVSVRKSWTTGQTLTVLMLAFRLPSKMCLTVADCSIRCHITSTKIVVMKQLYIFFSIFTICSFSKSMVKPTRLVDNQHTFIFFYRNFYS